ncbi:hypothetical protein J2S40_002238 [Nocardioides luteus]|uniref:Rubrerythrin family protein n=1 Tax=Nocardioides luteus TaxID=1844 RepID=A0ABQ5SSD6_9ACTN|nr:hypothetical protein [Nocardioides luteus]MDR7311180.1 hypothetical protein [Nocardioides luteus]GGR62841.1 hypothetical protein GCM10010197_32680 [Nocardioides luteus]GLJ66726.1 hypothetical protein GCM10017579_07620 [Nocardioides luteus]
MNDENLQAYLQHHWAGSSAGLALFRRVGQSHSDPQVAAEIRQLAAEMNEDRESLRDIIEQTGGKPSPVATATGRALEFAGRFKPNGRIVRRSALADLFDIEALRDAVNGKRAGWHVLLTIADEDPRLDPKQLAELMRRADDHIDRLEALHLKVGPAVFHA